MIPKSCRLFGQDHAQSQRVESAMRFKLNISRFIGDRGHGVGCAKAILAKRTIKN